MHTFPPITGDNPRFNVCKRRDNEARFVTVVWVGLADGGPEKLGFLSLIP